MKKSNCQIVREVQIRDTIIKPHIVHSEHKFDCTYLDHVALKTVTSIVRRCNFSKQEAILLSCLYRS